VDASEALNRGDMSNRMHVLRLAYKQLSGIERDNQARLVHRRRLF